jgi:flavin reductase (DIM6/NTAB) family NADH-FMN oxidoreductase RutF
VRVSPDGLNHDAIYKLMTGVVVPRPIAWVTTISAEGVVNLAPFSAFTFLSVNPPMVGFNVSKKPGGRKDTARNIHGNGEFVVNIADEALMETLHASGGEFPPDVSEVEVFKLLTEPSATVGVPRLAAAPISLECRLEQVATFGRSTSEFMVGEVTMFHFRDGLYVDGKINTAILRPIARLAGPSYAKLGEIVTFKNLIG